MRFQTGQPRPANAGRKKGTPNKPRVTVVNARKSVASFLEENGVYAPAEVLRCYQHAMWTYENYAAIYKAICEGREQNGLYPTEDKALGYLVVASNLMKELMLYCHSKMKASEAPKISRFSEMTIEEQMNLHKQAIALLEEKKNGAGSTGGNSSPCPESLRNN